MVCFCCCCRERERERERENGKGPQKHSSVVLLLAVLQLRGLSGYVPTLNHSRNRFYFFDSARGREHVFVHEDQNVTRSTTGTTAASLQNQKTAGS